MRLSHRDILQKINTNRNKQLAILKADKWWIEKVSYANDFVNKIKAAELKILSNFEKDETKWETEADVTENGSEDVNDK